MIIESNTVIAERITDHLRRVGFDLIIAEGYAEATTLLQRAAPELIVLDAVLDDGSGYDLCAGIRAGGTDGDLARVADTPILMLMKHDSAEDRLRGFRTGADDCLIKPYNYDELVFRVCAILRRSTGVSNALTEIGALTIDPRRRQVWAAGQAVALTPKEFDLLHLLASSPGRVFPREELLERVWGYTFLDNTRTVDVHINRLRQKLSIHAPCDEMIDTEWGIGYKLIPIDPEAVRPQALATAA